MIISRILIAFILFASPCFAGSLQQTHKKIITLLSASSPSITVTPSPSSWDPADGTDGDANATQDITLTSVNGSVTYGTSAAVLTTGTQFSITSDTCSSSTVTVGNSCTISLSFVYSTGGPYSDTLTVTSDASDSPETISLGPTTVSAASTAITLEQSSIINTSAVASTAPTITPSAANNLLVVGIGAFNTTGSTACTVSDNVDGSWTRANSTERWMTGAQGYTAIFYKVCTSTATRTVTIAMASGNAYFTGVLAEYSGLASSSPLDVEASATGTSTAPLATTSTTTQADTLVLSFSYINNNPTCTTPSSYVTSGEVGTSFVNVGALYTLNADYETAALEQKIVSATGTQASSWVYSSSYRWGCVTVVFKGQ